MPAERTINCPACGVERSTKAGSGTRVRCKKCGEIFRTPPADAAAQGPAVADAPAAGGVKVVRASSTKVKQTARPRAAGSKDSTAPAGDAAATDEAPVDDSTSSTKPPAVEPTRAQVLGRRGGRGYYAERVKGPRGRRG